MGSKTLLFFFISMAVVLMITSEVAAKSVDNSKTVETNEEGEAKYHGGGYGGGHGGGYGGGHGGYGGGGHGGYGHGGYGGGGHGGHPGEAADAEPQN
ncbi:cold and drought-regulated protein CORA-like isoform X3 [Coffea eugenioides]|uniref:cold and drought-regulated protein CORA-like isoform X3 n=1 Tax=Coffea eugenioides TaxID=49369 RepID=UPI000F5D1A0C|nr:cold and drought-regulated protein CORA-like isoform X1 [Coffea arabica]XP_027164644.1 cold and drought-regulated protein CORA-like isoform X3 [Coffea eugenioides]